LLCQLAGIATSLSALLTSLLVPVTMTLLIADRWFANKGAMKICGIPLYHDTIGIGS
jgi:hypothetical protein